MKKHTAMFALALTAVMSPVYVMAATSDISLGVREQQSLFVTGTLERISVADAEVADVLMVRGSGGKAVASFWPEKKLGAQPSPYGRRALLPLCGV